jgi:hypothetical protein
VARAINTFLLQHGLRLVDNPCISPDFCLDWGGLAARLKSGAAISPFPQSRFETAAGAWTLAEEPSTGDCAWLLAASATGNPATLPDHGIDLPQGGFAFPASWENLLRLKNLVQEQDPGTTIFPTAGANLGRGTLGVGARFTTLHWPAVEWAMAALGMGFTANQNSIPRELVYDTDVMLAGRLESVPFPFIGTGVPEGHQGQSVEGMSHGAVLSKLRTGFHRHRIEWSFNADHQPVGGRFDSREDALVRGCLLASYITFDLSPELAKRVPTPLGAIDPMLAARVRERITVVGCSVEGGEFERTLSSVWPAMQKAALRDAKYAAARSAAFTTTRGKAYLKELSIDELPGLTTQATTALVLALGEELGLNFDFIAPAFGFRKNLPFPDNEELRRRVALQWDVCRRFDVGIGFHSGSGKSAENYRVLGEVTGGCLEIKTSGRYTYEMGVALAASSDPSDRALWDDWYRFTLELAVNGAFSAQESERETARGFIVDSLGTGGAGPEVFESRAACRKALESLPQSPDHAFFFEYNFLFVLAAGGRADWKALGDHGPEGYAQRARFYSVSPECRLRYARGVAAYLLFLARETGLVAADRCELAQENLEAIRSIDEFIGAIAPPAGTPAESEILK